MRSNFDSKRQDPKVKVDLRKLLNEHPIYEQNPITYSIAPERWRHLSQQTDHNVILSEAAMYVLAGIFPCEEYRR
jgi:hypothetical protein